MSASDWTQIDSTNVELNSNNEVSTDLFGGDLFGDELLEMYSAGVNDENNGVGSIPNGRSSSRDGNSIPQDSMEEWKEYFPNFLF